MRGPRVIPPRPLIPGLLVAFVLLLAGCLPASVRPSPSGPVGLVSPSPSASPSPTVLATPAPPTPTPGPTFELYTVARGDNLLRIAKRFATTGRSVAYWNREAYPSLDPESRKYDPDRIDVGWVLRVMPGEVYQPPEDEPDTASPVPEPSLDVPSGPTHAPDGSSILVFAGGRGGNGVALTFELTGKDPAPDIAWWLVEHDVPATLFVTGTTIGTSPGAKAIIALATSHPDLLTLGNGTWAGSDLTRLRAAAIAESLRRCDAAIVDASGGLGGAVLSSKPFVRPPLGAQDGAVLAAIGHAGWAETVLWDVDPGDSVATASGGPAAEDIAARVLSRIQGGSIVRLRMGNPETLAALPAIVAGLRARGLVPVILTRLLEANPGG